MDCMCFQEALADITCYLHISTEYIQKGLHCHNPGLCLLLASPLNLFTSLNCTPEGPIGALGTKKLSFATCFSTTLEHGVGDVGMLG